MAKKRISWLFVSTVLMPTFGATAYFGLFASDVYVSESRFVVRSPERPKSTGLDSLLFGSALSRASDESYSVQDYVRSRDALRELDKKLGVKAAYSRGEIDVLSRFPGIDWDDSFENFHDYYLRHVQIAYDSASSIAVLRVRAFGASEAQQINELLLQLSEQLVNTLNLRSRRDLIDAAEREVKVAEERVKTAALALSAFRSGRAVFDPTSQSALQLQGVARLQEELIATEAQLAELRRVAPDNPQLSVLAARADGLRKAMAEQSARVTGGRSSFSADAPVYDRLTLEKGFADRQLGAALAALESARSEAQRKQLYLERLVQPNLPDQATEPRRIRAVVTVFVFGLLAWGVVSLIIAGIREHVD